MCEGASKQSPNPKNSSALGPRPGYEIPGSATDHIQFRAFLVHEITFYYLKVKNMTSAIKVSSRDLYYIFVIK